MSRTIEREPEVALLRGPALVTWLVMNTEKLVVVAATLDERAADLSPSVPRESVVELCQAVRHASLELTVALLSLLTQSDRAAAVGALASTIFSSGSAREENPSGIATMSLPRASIL